MDEDIEEGWTTMAELKAQGKVRHIGVSNFTVAATEARAEEIAPITSLQPQYSLAVPDACRRNPFPIGLEQNIGVIVVWHAAWKSGLLTGCPVTRERFASLPEDDFRKRAPVFQEP